jgi:hypothetical protein
MLGIGLGLLIDEIAERRGAGLKVVTSDAANFSASGSCVYL